VATRTTLAAATIPNNPRELAAWIRDPQAIKPGDRMPALGLSPPDVTAVAAYLKELH
jgi:cytochrome c oxidase subunit II